MPSSIQIRDDLSPALRRVGGNTRRLMQGLAKAVEVETRKHWREMQTSRPNKQGLPSGKFWLRHGRDNTAVMEVTDNRATIRLGDGAIRYQLEGGTIIPRAGKSALALPKTAAAKAAGDPRHSGLPLTMIPLPKGRYAHLVGLLVTAWATRLTYGRKGGISKGRTNTKQVGQVQYFLVDKVTHAPDPTVEPSPRRFDAPMREAAEIWQRLWTGKA